MECGICYEKKSEKNFKILECSHSICNSCFPLLRHNSCPFCRAPLNNIDNNTEEVDLDLTIIPVVVERIRHRRRRRRPERNNQEINVPELLSQEDINNIRRELSQWSENIENSTAPVQTERRRWYNHSRVYNSRIHTPLIRNIFI